MKIIISNTVILNGGDAAILISIIKILQTAFGNDTEFIIYDSQPETAKKYYPQLNLRRLIYEQSIDSIKIRFVGRIIKFISQWRLKVAVLCIYKQKFSLGRLCTTKVEYDSLLDYQTADLIVSTGGTYLVENYGLEARFFDYQISLMFNKPLIFFTQSLGPFEQAKNRQTLKNIFAHSALILLRDRQSAKHLQELVAQQNKIEVVADAAFALANLTALSTAKNKQDNLFPAKIAISVRDWRYFKTVDPAMGIAKYIQALVALTVHLVEKYQVNITYISSCQGIKEYWKDDSEFALNIVNQLPAEIAKFVTVNREFHDPETLINIISEYDLVIATRLHMAILSLGAGVPVFAIAYEFKTEELFCKLGQQVSLIDIENIDENVLINRVDALISSLPQVRQQLFTGVEQERLSAWQTSNLVRQAFKQWQLDHQ
ncbi:MAG: polysaccharide pyruvyl transferase family protein [Pleurocapsa minor HA4230-MV1]|jgi:colanic acid/amylovoran biosynthesis protein|nr:polysaccharide pyruvyl transferase family protein [Pleurocapsa minor HA4230-MV1]